MKLLTIKEKRENKLWYNGDVEKLRDWYINGGENGFRENKSSNFYAVVEDGERVIHSGIPSAITDTIVDLVEVDQMEITFNGGQEDKMDEIFTRHDLLDKLEEIVKTLTWSGEGYVKLNVIAGELDVEVVCPTRVDVSTLKGKVWFYEFVIDYTDEETERTIERYGKGYIETVIQEHKDGAWVDKPETRIVTRFGTEEIFATHIFIHNNAYSKNIGVFDSLEEISSRSIDEFRKGKMMRFIDENLLPKNELGKPISDEKTGIKDFVKLSGIQSEDGKPLIEYILADIDPEKRYIKLDERQEKKAIRNAGLSWHTFNGGEISGLSADSQRELEKTSIRTRRRYITRLKRFVAALFELIIFVEDNKIVSRVVTVENAGEEIDFVENPAKGKVEVIFNDYIQNSIDHRIKVWGGQEAQSTFPVAYRIAKILEGAENEEKIAELTAGIQEEMGMAVGVPNSEEED